ncbi:hypothetical protein B7463_g12157, partial [Scytalidium lignicola]
MERAPTRTFFELSWVYLECPLSRELSKDQSIEFVFVDGELGSEPGPGVEGFFEPPYYTYFKWPRSAAPEDDQSVEIAYELIYDILTSDEGPFDGLVGFSHGATLAFGFLVHHAKTRQQQPIRSLGLRRCIPTLVAVRPNR